MINRWTYHREDCSSCRTLNRRTNRRTHHRTDHTKDRRIDRRSYRRINRKTNRTDTKKKYYMTSLLLINILYQPEVDSYGKQGTSLNLTNISLK